MIRHLLITSAFLLVNTFIFATTANAEEGSANASGMVADFCNLGNPIDGNLGVNAPSNPTTLSSSASGGRAATVDITCNGDATLTISKPVQTKFLSGKTEFSDENLTATAKNSTFGVNVNSESISTSTNIFPGTSGVADMTLEVNMEARNGTQKISPGDYKFTVTITSTP
jgi:hypothetical protein